MGFIRERKKALTRLAMVETLIDESMGMGFDRTPVKHVTDLVGVSSRTFFRYFQSKEDAVFHHERERLQWYRGALADTTSDRGAGGVADSATGGVADSAAAGVADSATAGVADSATGAGMGSGAGRGTGVGTGGGTDGRGADRGTGGRTGSGGADRRTGRGAGSGRDRGTGAAMPGSGGDAAAVGVEERVRLALLEVFGDYMADLRLLLKRRIVVEGSRTLKAYDQGLNQEWESITSDALGGTFQAKLRAGAIIGTARAVIRHWLSADGVDDLVALGVFAFDQLGLGSDDTGRGMVEGPLRDA